MTVVNGGWSWLVIETDYYYYHYHWMQINAASKHYMIIVQLKIVKCL